MRQPGFVLPALALLGCAFGAAAAGQGQQTGRGPDGTPWIIAHRGASAYAPENTIPAFELAARQGATYVEFDLQQTKDQQIVCLHDNSLERTTDVEQVFPDRARRVAAGGKETKRWMLADFTLAEIKRLDAGAWFDAKYKGTRIPTFGETIDALRGRSGLFIELKTPELYEGIERRILAELKAKGLSEPGADPRTPVLLQSFTAASVRTLTETLRTPLPVHFLVAARDAAPWITAEGLGKIKGFATGLSPEKTIVRDHPEVVTRAHALGLPVTPYTFRASAVPGFADVRAEMAHYLEQLHVDGVITDNPDQAPGTPAGK